MSDTAPIDLSQKIGSWDNKQETGHDSPTRLVITERGKLEAEITAPNPAEALSMALQLLQGQHEATGARGPMVEGVARAAEILNDAGILEAESRRGVFTFHVTDIKEDEVQGLWDRMAHVLEKCNVPVEDGGFQES